MSSGRTTYVEPYVKSDGTKVKGHIRHVHGEEGESRHSGGAGGSHNGGQGGTPSSQSGEWSSLREGWRDGAKPSKPPKGGIDPKRFAKNPVCEVADGMIHVSMPVPSSAPAHPTIEEVTVRMSDPATQEMLVATYKRGQVSRTKGQRKWLAAEMSDDDRTQLAHDYDESVVYSNKIVYMSGHLRDKIARGELSVPQDVVEQTLHSFSDSFIEYSVTERNGNQSRRVLLRNNDIIRQVNVRGQVQDANLCLVLDIDTCCMVTAYWNAANDHHDTLNRNRYEHDRGNGKGRRNGSGGGNGGKPRGNGGNGQHGGRSQGGQQGNRGGQQGGRGGKQNPQEQDRRQQGNQAKPPQQTSQRQSPPNAQGSSPSRQTAGSPSQTQPQAKPSPAPTAGNNQPRDNQGSGTGNSQGARQDQGNGNNGNGGGKQRRRRRGRH